MIEKKTMVDGPLHYRRQFLLTHEICTSLSHWNHARVEGFHLYAHPDVELCTVTSADRDITAALVGYIIDPHRPEQSNKEILHSIVSLGDSFDRITDYLGSVSGRFVLFVLTTKDIWLFHDPCGLRTAYYTQHKGKVFVASQPNIFSHVMPLEGGERFFSYLESTYARSNREHWIPSGCSLHERIYHLVPNHTLCFSTFEQIRYWPKKPIFQKNVNEVVAEASDLLCKLIIAGSKRFKLAMPLTAGWDSRILLSALKGISNEVYFYTLQYRNLDDNSPDIRIPRKLLRSLGLVHHIIDCQKEVPTVFRQLYQYNTSISHFDDWGKIAYGMSNMYPEERVCIKGNCSEIARCFYYKFGTHQEIHSPEQIIALENGWNAIPFVCDQISNWFSDAREVSDKANIDILDLFYWEHRMGSWQAQSQLEWDIAQEAYTPFNHRGLIEVMLAASTKYRCAPNYLLYKMVMTSLWPDVTREPINPETTKILLKNVLHRIGLYKIAKKVRNRLS